MMNKQHLIIEANKGNREIQYQLGLIYCFSEDVNKAIFWLEKAKELNDKRAAEVLDEIKMFYVNNTKKS